MHGPWPDLDGKYTCFGQVVAGLDIVDKIAKAPKTAFPDGTGRPTEPQTVEHAFVIKVK